MSLRLCILTLTVFGHKKSVFPSKARLRDTVGSASDSRARGPRFNIQSSHILSFLLPLIQEEQLSVTDESMCT